MVDARLRVSYWGRCAAACFRVDVDARLRVCRCAARPPASQSDSQPDVQTAIQPAGQPPSQQHCYRPFRIIAKTMVLHFMRYFTCLNSDARLVHNDIFLKHTHVSLFRRSVQHPHNCYKTLLSCIQTLKTRCATACFVCNHMRGCVFCTWVLLKHGEYRTTNSNEDARLHVLHQLRCAAPCFLSIEMRDLRIPSSLHMPSRTHACILTTSL